MIRIRHIVAYFVLTALSFSAGADIQFGVGEPAEGAVKSGIGQISGWAVSDQEIVSVEALIDGVSLGQVPYGGTRMDVASAFPDFPDAEHSGWAMKWNYALHDEGEHLLTVVFTEKDGTETRKDVVFYTTRFNSEFISDSDAVRTQGATVYSPADGRLVIEGAQINGEDVDIELAWDRPSQQFLIDRVHYAQTPQSNKPPQVSAGPDQQTRGGDPITLVGSASDPDGTIVEWQWTQVSGSVVALEGAATEIVRFTAPEAAGTIRLRFTATDNEGASAADDVIITVEEPAPPPGQNQAPTANAGPDKVVETGDAVTLVGSASDSDGSVVAWQWTQISGPAVALGGASSEIVGFTAPGAAATIGLRFTVTDDDGAIGSDDVFITVQEPAPPPAPNQAPTANAGPDQVVETGDPVTVYGSASDSDGTVVAWQWTQVSGPAVALSGAMSEIVSFTAPGSAGIVRLRFTVTDDDGATDSDDVFITVEEPAPPPTPNNPPAADAGPDRTVDTGAAVTLYGSSSDSDGTVVAWQWTQVSGPGVALSGASSEIVSFTAPGSAGVVRLRFTVTDDDGATDSDDVYVTVEEPGGGGGGGGGGITLESMMDEINAARGQARSCGGTPYPAQPPLAWSAALAGAAAAHSVDMATNGFFSHTGTGGTSVGDRLFPVWNGTIVGENIAASSIDRSDAYVVQLWLDSPGHCALIMDGRFTHAGVGYAADPNNDYTYHHFWTLDFGG